MTIADERPHVEKRRSRRVSSPADGGNEVGDCRAKGRRFVGDTVNAMAKLGDRAAYRLRQGLRALRERPNDETEALARRYLDERGMRLFLSLSARDEFHSARTASILIEAGVSDRVLLQAALLHDVGKGPQALWQRAAYVVTAAAAPRLLGRLARSGSGWRGAFHRSLHHSTLGADLVRAAGYADGVVDLVAHHHDPPASDEQTALQLADERA